MIKYLTPVFIYILYSWIPLIRTRLFRSLCYYEPFSLDLPFSQLLSVQLYYHIISRWRGICLFQGTLAGLLIGLAQLNCSELRLKRLCCRSGLLGIDRVVSYALSEWLADIRGTQLSRILGGVGPVHSFLQLFQGLVDLVWLPIDQYRRDGRVMRGLQRGANSFTTSSAMAFLELTNRVVQLIQVRASVAWQEQSLWPYHLLVSSLS